jgi:hypothetical protein
MWRWLWLVGVIACSGSPDPTAMPDATTDGGGQPDAAVDTGSSANQVDLEVLTTTGDGLPDPDAIAVFYDPSGAVVAHGQVGADGRVHAELPDGGSVTVLQIRVEPNFDRTDFLTTIRGIAPGDQLVVGKARRGDVFTGDIDHMAMAFTPVSASSTMIATACGGGTSSPNGQASLEFHASCATPTFDILAIGDRTGGERDFIWQTGNAHVPGSSLVLANTWMPVSPLALTVENVPPNLQRVASRLHVRVGLAPFELDSTAVELPAPGTNTMSLRDPSGAGDGTQVTVFTVVGIKTLERFERMLAPGAASATVDLAALPLPQVVGVPLQTPTGATWTETPAGTPDARIVEWSTAWRDVGNNIGHRATWTVVDEPGAPTELVLQSLPAAYYHDDPMQQGNLTFDQPGARGAAVFYVDYDNLDGYAAARRFGPDVVDIERTLVDVPHLAHVRVR